MTARTFTAKPATRERVPLLVGLMGPSGSGKTFSALRLATGIQSVVGGKIYGVDSEARRMLHYADHFKFEHVPFDPPFGSLDYLAAIRFCVEQGAAVVVVDSMSHEHSGVGGMIEYQEQELERLAGSDWAKRERVKMLAWQKPKAARRKLIDGLLQLNANFIFCFRAKETVKPVKIGGKTEIVPQGFMPIAGDEFLFEQTVNCLLLPQSGGVPTWKTENAGERLMIKPAKQFDAIFAESKPLSEDIGRALAEWARGSKQSSPPDAATGAPSVSADPTGGAPTVTNEISKSDDGPGITEIDGDLAAAAESGSLRLQQVWTGLKPAQQKMLKAALDRRHKPRALEVDAKTARWDE